MDDVLANFLRRQQNDERLHRLLRESDVLQLITLGPQNYLAHYRDARGLGWTPDGRVVPVDEFSMHLRIPEDYVRRANVQEIITYAGPYPRPFHPNIHERGLAVCLHVRAAMPIHELLVSLYELWTYQNHTYENRREHRDDGLNPKASHWLRRHPERAPTDRRGLIRAATGGVP